MFWTLVRRAEQGAGGGAGNQDAGTNRTEAGGTLQHGVAGAEVRGLGRGHLDDPGVGDDPHPGGRRLEVRHRRRCALTEPGVARAVERREPHVVARREREGGGIRRLESPPVADERAARRDADQSLQPGDPRGHLRRGGREDLAHGTDLRHRAPLDDHQPVGEGGGIHRVVGHRDRRDPGEALAQHRPDLRRRHRVESDERLVEEHDPRLRGERPRHRDPLLLSARQLRREAITRAGQTHAGQPLFGRRSGDGCRHPGRARTEGDVLARGEVREQPGVLPEQHDAAVHRGGAHTRSPIEHAPVERDLALVEGGESGQRREQRRLARAAAAHHGDGLSRGRLEPDVDGEVAATHDDAGAQGGGIAGVARLGHPDPRPTAPSGAGTAPAPWASRRPRGAGVVASGPVIAPPPGATRAPAAAPRSPSRAAAATARPRCPARPRRR